MVPNEATDAGLNIRPAIVVFFGEDAFACRESYSKLLGKYADLQRTLVLSNRAEKDEWRDFLHDAFQLFTAVSMKRLLNAHFISDETVESVPVYIVVRAAIQEFAALIETVIACAESEDLAEKLQFTTVTDLSRAEELRNTSAMLHAPVDASRLSRVALQNTVVAISDYWRGVRIGSDEQIQLALARVTALLSLSEYSLEEGHLGFLKNGVLGGRTFWVGLGSYSVDRLDVCARAIYADLLKEAISRTLACNSASIIGELQDSTYAEVLSTVADRIGRPIAPDGTTASTDAVYSREVVPRLLQALCSRVRTKDELLAVLESLARRLRTTANTSAACTVACVGPAIALVLSPETTIAALVTSGLAITVLIWLIWRRRIIAPEGTNSTTDHAYPANAYVIPTDAVLADVLDDLRRELMAKLPSSETDVHQSGHEPAPNGLLIGERRLMFEEMFRNEAARQAGAGELGNAPEMLILLTLESGRWRTPEACKNLLVTQTRVADVIERALRTEFIDSVISGESQRLADKAFVQQVLYAPPLSPGAPVYSVGIAPLNCPLPHLTSAVDRSYLSDCFHFLYLVEANV
jgi:hypothetical protein